MHIDSHNPRNPKIHGPLMRYGPMVGSAVAGYGAAAAGAFTGNPALAIGGFGVGALGSVLGMGRAVGEPEEDSGS